MRKFIFVVGGVRSGKSSYSVELARSSGGSVVFVATCTFQDEEMAERIKRHQRSRPASWEVITEGMDPGSVIEKAMSLSKVVLVDCLGMWVFNLMERYPEDGSIEAAFEHLSDILRKVKGVVIIVSNEAGCGVVPAYESGRRFRDLIGRLNQIMAREADEVVLMQVGIPAQLKTAKGRIG